MKEVKIVFLEETFEELKEAVKWDGRERAAHALCKTTITPDGKAKVMPYKIFSYKNSDYVSRSSGHFNLKKTVTDKTINEAIDTQSDSMSGHVHPGNPGEFSGIDKRVEPEFMRGVADQIEGIIQTSIVFSNDQKTLDAWYYDTEKDVVRRVQKVVVVKRDGIDVYVPKRSNLRRRGRSIETARTEQAFGKKAVRKLNYLDVGIVGASSLGGQIIEMVARDNYNSLIAVDPDKISETNLNRLIGTTTEDIGKNKAEHYAEYAKRINPAIKVEAHATTIYEETARKALAWADIVFGCVDGEARLSINRLCLANLAPYFDLGAGITRNNGDLSVGGQVHIVVPGRNHCLTCTEVFRSLEAKFLAPQERERERRQGYLKSEETESPLVMFLDGVVTGVAYYQALKYVWGQQKSEVFSANIDIENQTFMGLTTASEGCIWCQRTGMLGMGEEVPALTPKETEGEVWVPQKRKGDEKWTQHHLCQ